MSGHELVKHLLQLISEVPENERETKLQDVLRSHEEELGEEGRNLLCLLASHIESSKALLSEEHAVDALPAIDGYQILEQVSRGLMGDVYRAVEPPPLERLVAIKVLRRGLLGRRAFEGFHFEREAMKDLEHPNIALTMDAGDTKDGFPYIVMPWIQGTSIVSFADRERLGVMPRLQLMRQVCEGLVYAHQKGLVHRDLKPSNVLVANVSGQLPRAYLIDFGVAARTVASQSIPEVEGSPVGTRGYMSPEQARGAEPDQKSDLYSFGVLLFEIMTGGLPEFEHRAKMAGVRSNGQQTDLAAWFTEKIRERFSSELPKPRVKELGWIVERCLEEEPTDRYATSQALCSDLERFVQGHALQCAPRSLEYQARKILRRHPFRAAAVATVVTTTLVVTGSLLFAVQRVSGALDLARSANRQKERALIERAQLLGESEAATSFLIAMLSKASPRQSALDRTVSDMLEDALIQVDDRLSGQSAARWKIHDMLANVLRLRGDFHRSLVQSDYSQQDAIRAYGKESLAFARSTVTRAEILQELGRPIEARGGYLSAIETLESLGESSSELALVTQVKLAELEGILGNLEISAGMLRAAFDVLSGMDSQVTNAAYARLQLIDKLVSLGRLDEASRQLEAFDDNMVNYPDHVVESGMFCRFKLFREQGRVESARSAGEEYLKWCSTHLGPGSPKTLQMRIMLTAISDRSLQGHSVEEFKDIIASIEQHLGDQHPLLVHARYALGVALRAEGLPAEAIPWLDSACKLLTDLYGYEHPNYSLMQAELGRVLLEANRSSVADQYGVSAELLETLQEERGR